MSGKSKTLVFWAGGFKDYKTDQTAIAALKIRWFPMSKDFKATADLTKFANGITKTAKTKSDFINQLRTFNVGGQTTDTISRIVFIGHGDGESMGFGGFVHTPKSKRQLPEVRITDWLDKAYLRNVKVAHIKAIRDRLTANARIDIVACVPKSKVLKAGAFTQLLANYLQATVYGFNKELEWELLPRTGIAAKRGGIYDPRPPHKRPLINVRRVIYGTHQLPFQTRSTPTQKQISSHIKTIDPANF